MAWFRDVYKRQELDVALGVDVVGDAEGDFGKVLDVAILVDDDDALGEHGLAHGPDACLLYTSRCV